ncbi:Relaxase/mobilization nuclease family protein, partial [mine drainage metagenome]
MHRAELRDRHNNEKRELLDEQRQTRAQVRSDATKQGKSPELALSLWAYHAAIQREALQKRQAAERKAMTAMLPHSEVWRKWLESQAKKGDEAALRIASQKYGGKVDITGSSEFRERATREATRLGIRVLNGDLQ